MMLALRLEYLTGRVVATRYNDRSEAEWPPHPARFFSALVAAWGEQDPPCREEQLALEWLESLPPPQIADSPANERGVVTHYVPVNDPTLQSQRLLRLGQERDTIREQALAAEQEAAAVSAGPDPAAAKKARSGLQRWLKDIEKIEAKYAGELADVVAVGPATKASLDVARALLPDSRIRQPRGFPSVVPHHPVVHFVWPDVKWGEHRPALDALVARLVSLGHSSSLVHARWVDAAPAPTWVPDDDGPEMLRVPATGQLARLRDEYARHQAVEPRVLPFRPQRYAPCHEIDASVIAQGVFSRGDWIILRRAGGALLQLTQAAAVAKATRNALMSHLDQPVPELLSGHMNDGRPSSAPHLAIVPLPHVGHRHADGRIMGVALVLPEHADDVQRQLVLRALALWEQAARIELDAPEDDAPVLTIGLGRGLILDVERVVWGEAGAAALRAGTWCTPAREWLSVTPVALDRNPGNLRSRDPAVARAAADDAARTIATACTRVGLPQPASVTVLSAGPWAGAAPAEAFPPFPAAPGKLRKVKVHARVIFDEPVFGPLLLGAGRFHGLGLFRPVHGGAP